MTEVFSNIERWGRNECRFWASNIVRATARFKGLIDFGGSKVGNMHDLGIVAIGKIWNGIRNG